MLVWTQNLIQNLITVLCAVLTLSRFWALMRKRHDKKGTKTRLLVDMGHDRIVYLGMKYVEHGYGWTEVPSD